MDNKYREKVVDSVRVIMATKEGRTYLHELLDFCGLYRPSMTGTSDTFFREGMRSTGLKILADITEADPDGYIKLMQETKSLKSQIKLYDETKKRKDN